MKFSSVTIQVKATEQYFPVVLFIMLYKVVLTFECVDEITKYCTRWFYRLSLWMKFLSVTTQVKATEQYFPVVLFIMLYKVILTFESVDEILKCGHSNDAVEVFDKYYGMAPFIMLQEVVLMVLFC